MSPVDPASEPADDDDCHATPRPAPGPLPPAADETDEFQPSLLRIFLNAVSTFVAFITLAPMGLCYMIDESADVTDVMRGVFWLVFLAVAGVGALLPGRRSQGSPLAFMLTLIVMFTALLNLGGCVAMLQAFGRATGG